MTAQAVSSGGSGAAGLARRWPVATFFVLTFVFTWALLPLASRSVAFALLALFGPAAGAFVTASLIGRSERRALGARIVAWRVRWIWYTLALLAPVAISALAAGIETLAGASGSIHLQAITPLQAVVFVMVLGEEIGWRGFALPHLLPRLGPWRASILLGAVWALWHLPLFYMRGMPQYGSPFAPYVLYTISLSILLTVFGRGTGHSVVIATLFHGAVNTFGFVNAAATPVQRGWGNAASYGLVALVAGLLLWRDRPASR